MQVLTLLCKVQFSTVGTPYESYTVHFVLITSYSEKNSSKQTQRKKESCLANVLSSIKWL
jgi:hypothetical protein